MGQRDSRTLQSQREHTVGLDSPTGTAAARLLGRPIYQHLRVESTAISGWPPPPADCSEEGCNSTSAASWRWAHHVLARCMIWFSERARKPWHMERPGTYGLLIAQPCVCDLHSCICPGFMHGSRI
jgi:hypothetical protein